MPNALFETRLRKIMLVNCVHQNKYPIQYDEYNYLDSLKARLIENRSWKFTAVSKRA